MAELVKLEILSLSRELLNKGEMAISQNNQET